jgi:hypothetical protein
MCGQLRQDTTCAQARVSSGRHDEQSVVMRAAEHTAAGGTAHDA